MPDNLIIRKEDNVTWLNFVAHRGHGVGNPHGRNLRQEGERQQQAIDTILEQKMKTASWLRHDTLITHRRKFSILLANFFESEGMKINFPLFERSVERVLEAWGLKNGEYEVALTDNRYGEVIVSEAAFIEKMQPRRAAHAQTC